MLADPRDGKTAVFILTTLSLTVSLLVTRDGMGRLESYERVGIGSSRFKVLVKIECANYWMPTCVTSDEIAKTVQEVIF